MRLRGAAAQFGSSFLKIRPLVVAAVVLGTARPHNGLCGGAVCGVRLVKPMEGSKADGARRDGTRLCLRALRGGMRAELDSSEDPEAMVKIRKKEQRGRKKLERKGMSGSVGAMGQAKGKRARAQESQAVTLKKQRHAEQALQEREVQLLRRQSAVRQQLGVRSPGDLQAVLYMGVQRGDVFVVDRCIFAGAQVTSNYSSAPVNDPLGLWNASAVINATCLHVAARNNHTVVIARLLQARADVNARTCFGFTPLMTAAHRGSLAAAMALVEAGADVHAADEEGYTAAELAETYASDWRVALWFRQVLAWLASPASSEAAGRHRVPMPRPLGPNEYPDPRAPQTSMLRAPVNLRQWSAPPAPEPVAAAAFAGSDGYDYANGLQWDDDEELLRSRFLISDSYATTDVACPIIAPTAVPETQEQVHEHHGVETGDGGDEDSARVNGGLEDDVGREQGAVEGVGDWEQVQGNPFE